MIAAELMGSTARAVPMMRGWPNGASPETHHIGTASATCGYSAMFGPFRLCPRQRLLLEGNTPLHIGGRALDILVALVERAGELVTKQELVARVWPGLVVDDSNLKVHVAALRRTLHDGKAGNRYICTVSGRGYSFVAPVTHEAPRSTADILAADAAYMAKDLLLAAAITGDYQDGVSYVDLGATTDPQSVVTATAATMGIEMGSDDPLIGIRIFLEGKDMLLVLDHCRHVIESAAAFVADIQPYAPTVQILTISR